MLQRAASTGLGPSCACLLPAGRWRRLTVSPLDFQLDVTILQTESSRRSIATGENVALDRTTVLQFDSDGTDSALDTAADRHVLSNDTALDLCAIANQKL